MLNVGCMIPKWFFEIRGRVPRTASLLLGLMPIAALVLVWWLLTRGIPEERVLGPGEAALIPVNVEHSLQVLEDLQTINCKSVVPGWSVYNARWEK